MQVLSLSGKDIVIYLEFHLVALALHVFFLQCSPRIFIIARYVFILISNLEGI